MGGGAGWWDAREAPLARLASTLLTRLRSVARGGAYGGPSSAEVDSIGGGAPGAGITAVGLGVGSMGGVGGGDLIPPLPPSRCKALLRALLGALLRPPNAGGGGRLDHVSGLDPEVRWCRLNSVDPWLKKACFKELKK